VSAQNENTQSTLTEETAAEYTRRRAQNGLERTGGPSPTTRFLLCVPPDTEIDELPELWDVYKDAVGGVDE
jgi:hypothetical protein